MAFWQRRAGNRGFQLARLGRRLDFAGHSTRWPTLTATTVRTLSTRVLGTRSVWTGLLWMPISTRQKLLRGARSQFRQMATSTATGLAYDQVSGGIELEDVRIAFYCGSR